jgi:steroid delta-isomerase-like uncharacterized protein
MSAQENVNLVRRFLEEAYNHGDLTVGDALLTPDCVFHIPNDITGIDGWKQFAKAFLIAFPDDLQVTIEDIYADDDKVAARWTAQGTHNGPLRGIPPTGKQVTWMGIGIYHLTGGKIREVWGLNDAPGIMQQIGALPSR